jgi:hypothetical protein
MDFPRHFHLYRPDQFVRSGDHSKRATDSHTLVVVVLEKCERDHDWQWPALPHRHMPRADGLYFCGSTCGVSRTASFDAVESPELAIRVK